MKSLENTLILCSSVSDKWQKTLKTPKKVGGRVGKEGVLGGVNRLSKCMKKCKNITEPVTK